MTKRIFLSTITVVVSVLLLSLALITGVLYEHFQKIQMDQLEVTESLWNRVLHWMAWTT